MFGNPVSDPQIQSHADYLAGRWDGVGFIVTAPFASIDASHRTAHTGLDLGQGRAGGAVLAAAAGNVSLTRLGDGVVIVDHPGGWQTVYAHLRLPFEVTQDKAIVRGQVIGHVGSTGTTLAHLHFETKLNGVHRDPWPLLDQETDVNTKGLVDINNKDTVLKIRANFKADSTLASQRLATFEAGTTFRPKFSVKGDLVSGSDVWLFGHGNIPGSADKGVGFIHSSAVGPLVDVVTPNADAVKKAAHVAAFDVAGAAASAAASAAAKYP